MSSAAWEVAGDAMLFPVSDGNAVFSFLRHSACFSRGGGNVFLGEDSDLN